MSEVAFFCPVPTRVGMLRGLKLEVYRLNEDGELERRCSHCQEYWPADTEFFYGSLSGLNAWCCACLNERKREKRRAP